MNLSLRALAAPALLALPFVLTACDAGDPSPTEIRRAFVTQIVVEDAPLFQPDGSRWDGGVVPSGPDLYFRLLGNNDVQLLNAEEDLTTDTGGRNYSDVGDNDFPLVWNVVPEFLIDDLDRTLVFEVKDDDPLDSDDLIQRTDTFRIRDYVGNGQPTSFVVRSADGAVSIRVRVRFDD